MTRKKSDKPSEFVWEDLKKHLEKENKSVKKDEFLPMRPEWRVARNAMKAEAEKMGDMLLQLHKQKNLATAKRNAFWVMVENDTGIYDEMRYNEEKDCIEVIYHNTIEDLKKHLTNETE